MSTEVRAELAISEFMAENTLAGHLDEDGEPSDWIEITNVGAAPVSALGYNLTDNDGNLTKWTFPDVTVEPGAYLIVFASQKDRTDPNAELHTNFALGANGEYLALVKPDGTTTVTEFAPEYPEQHASISYGLGSNGAITAEDFVEVDAPCTYFVPSDGALGLTWTENPDVFSDATWSAAVNGVGFETSGANLGRIGTNIRTEVTGNQTGFYVRYEFDLPDGPGSVLSLGLEMVWDDGFVAYLNGTRLSTPGNLAPASPQWNSTADSNHSPETELVVYDISSNIDDLRPGANVLAVHAMNSVATSSDLLVRPRLFGEVQDISQPAVFGFAVEPTPADANDVVLLPPPADVVFSQASGLYTENISVTLSCPTPGAVIRFTTDLNEPTNDPLDPSEEYTGPIPVDSSTQIRAAAYLPGSLPGATATSTYLKVTPSVAAFSSDLPVVVMSTLGKGVPPESTDTDRKDAYLFFFEPDPNTGRTVLSDAHTIATRAGIRKRGSSSRGWPKYGMSVETWEDIGLDLNRDGNYDRDEELDNNIEPFGFDREADWIFNSRYEFDKSLMRNPLIYDLSRQAGRYAVRTQFMELFLDVNVAANGGEIADPDYWGVYCLMEKIEMDPNRVEVERLMPWDNSEPEVTGGYIFKRDRNDAGNPPTYNVPSSGGNLIPHDPGGLEVTPQQKSYIEGYLNAMNVALTNTNGGGVNQATGLHFSDYLDVDSWIDHHWLNTLAMNVDWGRLSAYYHKDRLGVVHAGPIWDFDRNMGSSDDRDNNPQTWDGSNDSSRTWFDSRYPWFGHLIGPNANPAQANYPDVRQRHTDRWFELRNGAFSNANMHATVDRMADELREAQVRNFQKWPSLPRGNPGSFNGPSFSEPGFSGWEAEVSHLKGWLAARADWIDTQYLVPPTFSSSGGVVPQGFPLDIDAPEGAIYYTLDGTDPRAPGGGVSPNAMLFSGGAATETTLVGESAPCTYIVPTDGSLGLTWTENPDIFSDATWTAAVNGVGFETSGANLGRVGTNIKDTVQPPGEPNSPGFYVRYEFDLPGGFADVVGLNLDMVWDDGFAAYLNGAALSTPGSLAPASPQWNSTATDSHSPETELVSFDLSANINDLRPGANVLAIHAMNVTSGSSDMLVQPVLTVDIAAPLAINETTTVTARAMQGGEWSAPEQITLVVGSELADDTSLVISELMYNPEAATAAEMQAGFLDGDLFEFVELLNISGNPIDLSDVTFADGIDFSFTNASVTVLMPGERVLVVKNRAAFEERYGNGLSDRIAGEFENDTNLRDSGENIRIEGFGGAMIRDFTYDDRLPWPESPDGDGPSLVLVNPGTNPAHGTASNWRPSVAFNGNPGADDSGEAFVGDPNADNDRDGLSAIVEHALGTSDANGGDSGRIATSLDQDADGLHLRVSHPVNLAADDVVITPEISTSLADWAADALALEAVTEVHNGDGTSTITYEATAPVTAGPGLYVRLRIDSR